MKRKLINYEVFTEMRDNSLSNIVKELVEASDYLARALDLEGLNFVSFNESTVIYEQSDGNYLRASYSVDNGKINFDNIEELVIDEQSEKQESTNIVRSMLEAILDDNEAEASAQFDKYMDIARKRLHREHTEVVNEAYARLYGSPERTKGKAPKISTRTGSKNMKKSLAAKAAHKRFKNKYIAGARKRNRNRSKENARKKGYKKFYSRLKALNTGNAYTGTRKKKTMSEWLNLANNVYNFVDFVENGHVQTQVISENNNLSVIMPTTKIRNEGKILKMHYDNMLKTDVKVLREAARKLVNDHAFCRMVADIKRYNNISNDAHLEESISHLVKNFPSVLYLTQEELSLTVGKALESLGVSNYDDNMCNFMAEGILRVAHDAYSERVNKIVKLANSELKESDDKYLDFQNVVSEFFPTLDESTNLEMKMFEDLYNTAVDIRQLALESQNDVVRGEAQDYISELEEVLNGHATPSYDLAMDVADWIEEIVEGNLPGAGEEMDVVKTPHKTVTGDHPQMAKNAKVPGHPGAYGDDYGDSAPQIGQDSMAWNHGDEARHRSWGNKGGKEVWPTLTNPHVPSPFGDYKIKGEKDIDSDDGLATWGDGDTFPGLQNPYIPKAVMPKQTVQPDNAVE